jgi:hypothetical protein
LDFANVSPTQVLGMLADTITAFAELAQSGKLQTQLPFTTDTISSTQNFARLFTQQVLDPLFTNGASLNNPDPDNDAQPDLNFHSAQSLAQALSTALGQTIVADYTDSSVGTATVTVVQAGGSGVSQIDLVTVDGSAGTFTLKAGGNTTSLLNPGIGAADLQSDIAALPGYTGKVSVTPADVTGGYLIAFDKSLGSVTLTSDASLLKRTAGELRFGLDPSGTVEPFSTPQAVTVTGTPASQTVTVNSTNTTFRLGFQDPNDPNGLYRFTGNLAANAWTSTVTTALQNLPAIGSNVTVGGSPGAYTVTFTGTLASNPNLTLLRAVSGDIPPVTLVTTTAGDSTHNQVETLTVNATSGTFELGYNNNYTAALAYNVSAADLHTAIGGLTGIGAANVTVSQSGNVYTITFVGSLGNMGLQELQTNNPVDIAIQSSHVQVVTVNQASGSFLLGYNGNFSAPITVGASASTVQSTLQNVSGIGKNNVSVIGSGTAASPYIVTFQGALTNASVSKLQPFTGDALADVPLNLNLDLGPLAGLTTASTAEIWSALGESLSFGIDLTPSPAGGGGTARLLAKQRGHHHNAHAWRRRGQRRPADYRAQRQWRRLFADARRQQFHEG